jgi:HAD superfamily hydrolase (TIGR01509 family)
MKYKLLQTDIFLTAIAALSKDPIFGLQQILKHQLNPSTNLGVDPDNEFLRACLTCDLHSPKDFANHIAKRFGLGPVSAEQLLQFETLLECERASVARYWDVDPAMQRLRDAGYILCVNSNLWPFAADHIFNRHGLGKLFDKDGLVLSYKEGLKKDDSDMYLVALKRFGIAPEESVFVGDSLQNDCLGPQKHGIKPFFLVRSGDIEGMSIPDGVTPVRDLMAMTEILLS